MSVENVAELTKENNILRDKVIRYETEVECLQHIIRLLKRDQFGSKSEKIVELEAEQLLLNEVELEAKNNPEPEEQFELVPGYKRHKGRGKKKPLPEDLPREEVIIDLPEAEKICPHDGTALKEIGEEITEKLKCTPAKMTVVIEKKKKYACPCCDGHMAQAKSNSILHGTVATAELLSFIVFSKFFQALPLYRIEELFKLQGIDLKRGTMANWLINVCGKLQPLWNILEEWVLENEYMSIDATSVQVLKEDGRKAESKSFMWARGSPELGIVLFDYDVSGGGKVAKRLVSGFKGALQSDAHKGYDSLDEGNIHRLGCMMHARRRFHQAYLSVQKKSGLAENAMQMFKKLYRYEEAYKKQGLTAEQRHEARQKEVKPYLEKMQTWAEEKKGRVPPQSPLGNAINYFLNEYDELIGFLKNGRYEIDNGWIERAIKSFAIGRKNWLFADTVAGANASSLFYSFVITAKLNGKDPFEVMTKIFQQLPTATTADDYERLAKLLVS